MQIEFPFYFKRGFFPVPLPSETLSPLEQIRTNSVVHQAIQTKYYPLNEKAIYSN